MLTVRHQAHYGMLAASHPDLRSASPVKSDTAALYSYDEGTVVVSFQYLVGGKCLLQGTTFGWSTSLPRAKPLRSGRSGRLRLPPV